MQVKDQLRPTWRPSAGSPHRKCTPSAACCGTSPGGGSLLSTSLSANLSRSFYSAAKISPFGGDVASGERRGAFPSSEARLACFPIAPRARLYGFIKRGAPMILRAPTEAAKRHTYSSPARAIPPPSARRAVAPFYTTLCAVRRVNPFIDSESKEKEHK